VLETHVPEDSAGVATAAFGDGRQVAYAEYGAPGGDAVLALHGTPGSRRLWERFDDEARRSGVRLLAPDRPGYGRSPPWPERTLADTAPLTAVLDDAGVTEAHVLGFSGGAPHALGLAATVPERVRSVHVVAGAVPPSFGAEKPRLLRAIDTLALRAPRFLRGALRVQTAMLRYAPPSAVATQYTNREDDLPEELAAAVARDYRSALSRSRQGFVTETQLLADEWDFDPAGTENPVMFYHGDRDDNVPLDGARRFADAVGSELTVLDGADHLGTLVRAVPSVLESV